MKNGSLKRLNGKLKMRQASEKELLHYSTNKTVAQYLQYFSLGRPVLYNTHSIQYDTVFIKEYGTSTYVHSDTYSRYATTAFGHKYGIY